MKNEGWSRVRKWRASINDNVLPERIDTVGEAISLLLQSIDGKSIDRLFVVAPNGVKFVPRVFL